ncbi:hypothetical protein GCM10027446_01390 [Angustibacter peucedani]
MTEYMNHTTGEMHQLTDVDGVARALLAEQASTARLALHVERVSEELREWRETSAVAVSTEYQDEDDDWAPWNWRRMPDDAARAAMSALREWVGWLRHRYPVAQMLPPCWPRHPELIEELSALHWAWRAAFHGDDPRPTAPADFHAHYLPGALERVKRWGVVCGDLHEPRAAGVYGPVPPPSTAVLDEGARAQQSAMPRTWTEG